VAGPAFPGFFKSRATIKVPDFGNMKGGVKIFVDMATLAVLANYSISFAWTKVPLKGFLNLLIGTARE
jgi:hypothetical protein